jgi:hypothetical protein
MSEFEQIATVDEVPSGSRKSVVIDETPALLLHIGNDFFAIEDVCTHDGQPLTDGPLNGCEITCAPANRSACRRPSPCGPLKSKSAATPFWLDPGINPGERDVRLEGRGTLFTTDFTDNADKGQLFLPNPWHPRNPWSIPVFRVWPNQAALECEVLFLRALRIKSHIRTVGSDRAVQ